MIKKLNLILILLLLLVVSMGSVCAADDFNETIGSDDNGDEILASEYSITQDNYNQYFSSSSGELIGSVVNAGDTLTLTGEFSSKNFTITKNIKLIGSGVTINNGVIKLTSGASGSEVCNMNIINTKNYYQGIFIDGAKNCNVHDNVINNTGVSSYPICLNGGANFNSITNNVLQTNGATYGHGTRSTSGIVLGSSNDNYIADNVLYCSDANAIYLSDYGGGAFKGGPSFNNTIYHNTINYIVNTTSWAYAIQLMGGNNTADSNIINGAYRGVSSSNYPLNKAVNNIINVAGTDFNTGAVTGGDWGIALAANATVYNNTVNGMFTGGAVSVGDYSVVENNYVNASKGYGVVASGDDVKIIGNEIYTDASAGVDQQGQYEGIVVDRNTIVSNSGIGVLLSKSSKTKYPSDITITNNKITTSNQYMINAADADKNSYVINNNTGTGTILTPEGEVDPSTPDFVFNGTTHIITPANYHNFIDNDGNLKNDFVHDGDILYFNGTFEDKVILVTDSIKITGENPTFANSTFVVTSDSVWIENLTIINKGAERCNAWGIFVADAQIIKILNNNISVYDPAAAYAVYIYTSSKVYVEDNTLFSSGDSLTYPLLGYGAEECEFTNNQITASGTGIVHAFEDSKDINANTSAECIGQCLGNVLKEHCLDGTNIVPEIYKTYGILMIKSSNNTVDSNNVSVSSKLTEKQGINSTNSIVGIDFYYDCDNNVITNNNIEVKGFDNYMYGAGALAHSTGQFSSTTAKNNKFSNNNIDVDGTYMATGFIFGQGCSDNTVTDNVVNLNADDVAYGITLENSTKTTVKSNDVTINADGAYGIEAYASSDNVIENNTIDAEGKLISAFAGVKANNNVIQYNTFNASGSGSDTGIRRDSIKAPNSGIYLSDSTGNLINENIITTENGYPVDFTTDSTGNNVTNNYLKGSKGSGNYGVNNSASNTVKDNYGSSFDNLVMNDMTAAYDSEVTITLESEAVAEGANVEFRLNSLIIGNATIKDAKATLTYDLNKNYNVGNYTITATLTKSGFKSEEITANLEIIKSNVTVAVDDVTVKAGSTAAFKATLTDSSNNPISGVDVRFYRNALYIGTAKSDENGVATANLLVPIGLKGNFTIVATVAESTNYNQGSGEGKLVLSDEAKTATQITAGDVSLYYKDGTPLTGKLTDLSGNAISGKQLVISINGGELKRTTKEDGSFSIPINLNPGEYPVEIKFDGDSQYEASSAAVTVTVKNSIVSNDLVKMYKNESRFYVAVMENGKPVANQELELNINGVIYKRTTNAVGTASIAINLPANEYIVTTQRMSTGEMKSSTITVKSLLVENNDVDMYFRNGTRYTVKVIKQDGNVAGAGEVVTFNINGVFYERKTNDQGIAGLNLNLEPNDYIITAEYKDCRVSNNIHIKPVLTASDLTKQFGDITPFSAKLVTGQGLPNIGKTITFNINGVFYNRTTDLLGIARLNINLIPGQYIITSMYENGAVTSNLVTVTSIFG